MNPAIATRIIITPTMDPAIALTLVFLAPGFAEELAVLAGSVMVAGSVVLAVEELLEANKGNEVG